MWGQNLVVVATIALSVCIEMRRTRKIHDDLVEERTAYQVIIHPSHKLVEKDLELIPCVIKHE